MSRFSRSRKILADELAAVRRQDPDLDAADVTAFAVPLLWRAILIALAGVLPLTVIRMSDDADAILVPLVASFALAAVSAAVVTWLVAVIISAVVTMALYRKPARSSSQLVVRVLDDSFSRIDEATSNLMLLALVVGLIALAVGLPSRRNTDLEYSVVEDLLAAQVALLLAVLAAAFLAEACRASADLVDDQSPALAWPWALLIVIVAWVIATVAGPLEFTTMVRRLLTEWLPGTVNDLPRDQAIDEIMPAGARWWATFGAVPVLTAIWYVQARRLHGFDALAATAASGDGEDAP